DRIIKDGKVYPGGILKVDCFLNHLIDVPFVDKLCEEIFQEYKEEKITKILTIEASGIGIACIAAMKFQVPVLFAKKSKTKNLSDDLYRTNVASFTHGNTNEVIISKDYLTGSDTVLIIDDFLANGAALAGLTDLVAQSGAKLAGAAVMIEKGFQGGGDRLRAKGIKVLSLAIIDAFDGDKIVFRQ
ncbi:MAG: xanthine phosphoribosyltransferase, partial [Clostridia bacterium]|nr:xanthine phosphoribosyltransferase [Clostridia bacterium]